MAGVAGAATALGLGCTSHRSAAAQAAVGGDDLLPPLVQAPGDPIAIGVTGVPRGAGPAVTVQAVREAVRAVDDLRWLSRGDSVLIKVACNSGNVYPATTDPVAIRAMVELLQESGAGRVIVADMSGVQFVRFWKDGLRGSSRALLESTGIARATREANADLVAFEEAGWDGFYEERPTVPGTWAGPVMLPRVLQQVDHIVLMPRCSRHLLAGSTLGLKAAVGWWRHDSRLEYHRDAATFAQKTSDANFVPTMLAKQRLVVTSATKILTTFGPDEGYVHEPEVGLIFATPSVVANDMLSMAWLLEGRRATPAEVHARFMADPNQSETFVNLANRLVTAWLGGLGEAARMEHLQRYDLTQVWSDRVLRRAFETRGGVPRIDLVAEKHSVPNQLTDKLSGDLRLAAA